MDVCVTALIFVVVLLFFWLCGVVFRTVASWRPKRIAVPVRDSTQGHHWIIDEALAPGHYCSVCELSMFRGAVCDCCGVVVDDGCLRQADRHFACKALAIETSAPLKHHWARPKPSCAFEWRPLVQVKGNLPRRSRCAVCDEPCGDGPGLRDFRCCWCQTVVHDHCIAAFSSICNLGKYRRMIIAPNCVVLKHVGWKGRRQCVVDKVVAPASASSGWSPLIVVANRKSGNGEGGVVLQTFRRVLNPAQAGLRWCTLLPNTRCRILVAGGDGTVGWILTTIEKLDLHPRPNVALLPLGTGNDLSRVLGWGTAHTGAVDADAVLESLLNAVSVRLDRWQLTVHHRRRFGIRKPDRLMRMSNYMSIGVDAAVTLNFHQRRETLPRAMSSRLVNKLLFLHYGTRDVLERACRGVDQRLELYLDGGKMQLPELEGIVVLNIPTWGAGVRPWSMGALADDDDEGEGAPTPAEQRFDDGLVEVFGLYSSFHIAQLQVGMGEPYRIGQAREVELRLFDGQLPMQVDGEPWMQPPAVVSLRRVGQARMLAVAPTSPASPPVRRSSFFY